MYLSNGRKIIIRQPDEVDAERLIDHSKTVFASTDQLLTTPEEYTMTVDREREWIRDLTHNPRAFLRIAETDGTMAGMLFFIPNPKKKAAHTGEFGINVHPDYQRMGIGRALVEALIHWARKHEVIEKLTLTVFATNVAAIELYTKLGFTVEGKFVRAVRQPDGAYIDLLQMYLETRSVP